MIFGVGVNDLSSKHPSYQCWHSMLRRGYSDLYKKSKPTYAETRVDERWHRLSAFDPWWREHAIADWQLDKDLLGNGKLYSEDICVFLPNEINTALQTDRGNNGLPPGVSYKSSNKKYVAQLSKNIDGKRVSQHLVIHSDPEICFSYYKVAKEEYVRGLADRHREYLDKRAYDAIKAFVVKR